MDRRYLGLLVGFAAVNVTAQTPAAPAAPPAPPTSGSGAPAPTPAPPAQALPPTPPAPTIIAGTAATDLVNLTEAGFSVPLRHGSILPGSETVTLNGRNLQRDTDYTMDYGGGVVYIMGSTKAGDSLSVNYRYDKSGVAGAGSTSPLNGLKFDLVPGSVNMQLGLGLAERGANGQVSRSNVFGWADNFQMKGGSAGLFQGGYGLTGLLMVDDHQGVTAKSSFETDQTVTARGSKATQKAQSQLIFQNFTSGLLGGHLTAGYQDISKDFAAFGNVSGVDQKTLAQLQKEKGLERQSLGMTDITVLGLKLNSDYKTVSDGNSGIAWRDFGMKQGAFNLGFNEQKVDKSFTRFTDLAETNQADLKRAVGLDRQTLGFGYAPGKTPTTSGALQFNSLSIEDPHGGKIEKDELTYTSKKFKFDLGSQNTDHAFTSFGNLTDAEKPVFQFDNGLKREWLSFSTDVGKGYTPFSFAEKSITSTTGQFISQDLGLGGNGWTFAHSARAVSQGFNSFSAINQADTDGNINAIAAMYGPTAPNGTPIKPNPAAERGLFDGLQGIQREYNAASIQPFKTLNLGFTELNLQGANSPTDAGSVEAASITGGNFKINYRDENLSPTFTQLPQLMSFERQSLGTIVGLKRTDLGVSMDLGKGQTFTYSYLDASANPTGLNSGLGAAAKEILDLKTKTFEISYNERAVSDSFTRVGELVDSESSLLTSLVGHDETDLKFGGTVVPGLKTSGQFYSDTFAAANQSTVKDNFNLNYDTATTSLAFSHLNQNSNNPMEVLLGMNTDNFNWAQKLGAAFKLHVAASDSTFDGVNTVPTTTPGTTTPPSLTYVNSSSHTFGLEYKLNATTNLASELTNTDYGNGEQSSIRSDSVSETITKRAGLTLSESTIDNPTGQLNTQTKRNYGFWYDLGKGMVFNYGYVRQLDTTGFATLNSLVSFANTPDGTLPKADQLGAMPVSSANNWNFAGGYAANQWQSPVVGATGTTEAQRTQAFSNVRIATAKPMGFGQIKNFMFNFSEDSAADNYNWIRQNQDLAFSGKYGATGFGYEYKSQMNTLDEKAVDRLFNFTTDASAKKFISATVLYKIRTLPANVAATVPDKNVMIRNYDITMRPSDKVSIVTQLMTNPEVTNGSAMLGSLTQGSHVDRWKLVYASTKETDLGATWEENLNESTHAIGRTAGINLTIWKTTSPLKFFYGFEDVDGVNVSHRTTERWSLQFDQRAGPNQSLNFFFGDISYGFTLAAGQDPHNLTGRVDYTWRF